MDPMTAVAHAGTPQPYAGFTAIVLVLPTMDLYRMPIAATPRIAFARLAASPAASLARPLRNPAGGRS